MQWQIIVLNFVYAVLWPSIESVAPAVPKWRYEETLNYVKRIEQSLARMDAGGKVAK
jgi:hypothetical protein